MLTNFFDYDGRGLYETPLTEVSACMADQLLCASAGESNQDYETGGTEGWFTE